MTTDKPDLYQGVGCELCRQSTRGGHYSISRITNGNGMKALRTMFPDGEANELNFVLFSTSGIHGTHFTIEEIEHSLQAYGDDPAFIRDGWPEDEIPADFCEPSLTAVIVQPRIVALSYTGDVRVTLNDIEYLKQLRGSSWRVVQEIGR